MNALAIILVVTVSAATTGSSGSREPEVSEPAEPAVSEPAEPGTEAPGPKQAARSMAAQGEAAFSEGRYDAASEAYRQAYALDPVPIFLFAWARSEQEAGRCEQAIEVYQRFIASGPPAEDVDRANLEVGRCYGELSAAKPEPEPEPEPQVQPQPEPESPPDEPRTVRAPWLRDPWGGALFAAGVAGLGTGLGLYFQATVEERRAQQAATTDEFREASRRATTLSGAGIVGFAVGGALVVGSVIRYAVVARRPRVAIAAGPRSAAVRVRF